MSTATELLQKLTADITGGEWGLLTSHLERGRVLEVRGVELVAVGMSIALDRVHDIERWLASGQVVPSGDLSIDDHPPTQPIQLLIVQPYALVQVAAQAPQ